MKHEKDKKPKKKSTGERLDNIERYLQGQAPQLSSYDPAVEYPKVEPPVETPPAEEPPKVEIL